MKPYFSEEQFLWNLLSTKDSQVIYQMWSSASLQHVRHVLGSLQLRLQETETGSGGPQECTPWSPTFYC